MEKTIYSVKKKCAQEYFQNMVLSITAIIIQLYLHVGSAQKYAKRDQSTQVFVAT